MLFALIVALVFPLLQILIFLFVLFLKHQAILISQSLFIYTTGRMANMYSDKPQSHSILRTHHPASLGRPARKHIKPRGGSTNYS